jgi:O-antigen ligase
MVAKLSAPLLFLVTCVSIFISPIDCQRFEKAVLWSAGISLTFALSNYVLKYSPIFVSQGVIYLTVPGASPAPFSFHMGVAALLSFSNYLYSKSIRYLLLFSVFGAAVILAFTRISMVGLVFGITIILFISSKSKMMALVPSVCLCGVLLSAFFLHPTLKARMFQNPNKVTTDTLSNDPSSVLKQVHGSGRFYAWSLALDKFFFTSPVIGSGAGSTQAWFYKGTRLGAGVLHSEYLRLLCEFGIIGLGLFMISMGGYIALLVRKLMLSHGLCRRYAIIALGILAFYLVSLATDNSFDYVRSFGNYVFGFIALVLVTSKVSFRQTCIPERNFGDKCSGTWFCSAVGCLLIMDRDLPSPNDMTSAAMRIFCKVILLISGGRASFGISRRGLEVMEEPWRSARA